MTTREASHAGSWYSSSRSTLSSQLDSWLDAVPATTKPIGPVSSRGSDVEIPSRRARVIIAPHAGYSYSGPAAAWAYKSVDLTNVQRVFVLGPSHHHYLSGCALSQCTTYATPLGDLQLDLSTIAELHKTGKFERMSVDVDEAEHSIEMQLPYIYKILSRAIPNPANHPPIIPILVGSTSATTERSYGHLLAPYLAEPTSIFVISSDFAHWGTRFRYTYYQPHSSASAVNLKSNDRAPTNPPIHESIKAVDMQCVAACEQGGLDRWLEVLRETGNTVCGRHPIGVVLAAIETLEEGGSVSAGEGKGRFRFVRYERSSEVASVRDSSVSYCSGFAVL